MTSLNRVTSPQYRRQHSGNTPEVYQHHLRYQSGRLPTVPIIGLGEQEVPLVRLSTSMTLGSGQQPPAAADLNPLAVGNENPAETIQNTLQTVLDLISEDDF